MSSAGKRNENNQLKPTLENIEDWPIYKLGQVRDKFVNQLVETSMRELQKQLGSNQALNEELAKALYLERIRIKSDPWKVDPPDDSKFWKRINERLVKSANQKPADGEDDPTQEIFKSIVARYAEEIAGNFNPRTYRFASKMLPVGFSRLLNTVSLRRFFSNKFKIRDRIKVTGEIEHIKELSKKGTILLVPTHFSNLDSILIGWAIHSLGLPAFLYGAGLNLFNSSVLAYFMGGLGAYRVDRRKRNKIYIETLKMYSRNVLMEGCHSLFFPGGTRARSGELETKLKLGLLSTAIDAQRLAFSQKTPSLLNEGEFAAKKIFVVPLVINYHFVLEASNLIDQHLKRSGKEKYFVDKQIFPSNRAVSVFLQKFISAKSEAILSFGKPIDVLGNTIDESGESIDRNGRKVDIAAYFKTNGKFKEDSQRDSEYTKILADNIIEQFKKANTVMSSHLIAYTAFEMMYKKNRRLDLYGLLRLPEEDRIIPYEQFTKVVERLRDQLKEMADNKEVQLAYNMVSDVDRIIHHGLTNLGVYHNQSPLKRNKDGDIISEDMNLLYFYHNRLNGYGLDQYI